MPGLEWCSVWYVVTRSLSRGAACVCVCFEAFFSDTRGFWSLTV